MDIAVTSLFSICSTELTYYNVFIDCIVVLHFCFMLVFLVLVLCFVLFLTVASDIAGIVFLLGM